MERSFLDKVLDAVPVCGVDFCDTCGDCLRCSEEDPCYGQPDPEMSHFWVEYKEDE